MNLYLTVIIPTYNRKNTLRKCLNAIFDQVFPPLNYEVIIIDDGSMDGTKELVNSLSNNISCVLRYFKQKHEGPAAARNVGITNAQGEVILFIGDDIITTPNLLEEHFNWHKRYPGDNIAVLGYVTWSPEIEITPFMKWLENRGPQFAFWQIRDKVEVDTEKYFYTSNISLKKSFLLQNGLFDEKFPYAAYEDTELGYRLKTKGMILKYNKDAVAYHYHYTSLRDACRRMIKVGFSKPLLAKKIREELKLPSKPLLRKVLSRFKFIIYYLLAKFYEKREIKADIFGYIMDYYRETGVKKYRNRTK